MTNQKKEHADRPSFLGQEDKISWFPNAAGFKFLCDDCGLAVNAEWQGAGYLFAQVCHACGRQAARARSYDADRAREHQDRLRRR